MQKTKVHNLSNILVQVKSSDFIKQDFSEHSRPKNNKIINQQEEESDNWVQANIELGVCGEEYIKNILIENYGEKNIRKEPDYLGYDFYINDSGDDLRIEVKTTTRFDNGFFITINELKKAEVYGDNYYIFYLIFNDNERNIYVIKNPIKKLKIDMRFISTVQSNETCELSIEKVHVKIIENITEDIHSLFNRKKS